MFQVTRSWTVLFFVTLNLAAASLAFGDSTKADLEMLRQSLRQETTDQCLMGNFDFSSKRLKKQLALNLSARSLELAKIKNCKTLGEEVSKSLTESELQTMLTKPGKEQVAMDREALLAEIEQNPAVQVEKGKIAKVLVNGLHFGLNTYLSGAH